MASAEAPLRISVAFSARPGEAEEMELVVPAGATVGEAIALSGLLSRHPALVGAATGVWGRVVPADTRLRAGDRVELYRPLRVDPKEARRERYRAQKPPR